MRFKNYDRMIKWKVLDMWEYLKKLGLEKVLSTIHNFI